MLSRKEHTLSQKAMQMWCLIRSLPFLLASKIDEENVHMRLVVYLLRIMEIAFAPVLNVSILSYLDELVKDFLSLFVELFPDINLTNKMHHATHFSECIVWSGPMAHFSCIRYEHKHFELKERAENVNNFKNPPKTIIRVSQVTQSAKWSTGDVKLHLFKVGSGKPKFVCHTKSRNSLLNLNYQLDDEVLTLNSVTVNGVEYRKHLFVILEKAVDTDDNLYVFGRIEEIVMISDDESHLLVSECTTRCFDPYVNAYEFELAKIDGPFRFITIKDLAFYKPVCYWTKSNSDALNISLRHIIL